MCSNPSLEPVSLIKSVRNGYFCRYVSEAWRIFLGNAGPIERKSSNRFLRKRKVIEKPYIYLHFSMMSEILACYVTEP
jgi:hypothetical protein